MSACPKCSKTSSVIRSDPQHDGKIKRRRKCESCGFRYNTIEMGLEELKRMREMEGAIGSLKKLILGCR